MAEETKLEQKIETAVTVAVASPEVPASVAAVPAIMDALKVLIPEILNKTNGEKWYQSHVTWGAIFAIIGAILTLFGITFSPEAQAQYATIVVLTIPAFISIGGALWTLWGRWKAKKPIGS